MLLCANKFEVIVTKKYYYKVNYLCSAMKITEVAVMHVVLIN